MYYECSECQVVVSGNEPPFICPRCGLAGVVFCAIDEQEAFEIVVDGGEITSVAGPPLDTSEAPPTELR
jgi:hypothetical protein